MQPDTSIFLVGPMGSGKSAVGKRLARELGREFIDSDQLIEARSGVDIPFIFEREGEAGFRERECRVIDEVTQRPNIVLATGGGSAQNPESRAKLHERGLVVYLHTGVDQQLKRTGGGRGRPLLRNGDPREILSQLMAVREAQCSEVAHFVVDNDNRKMASVKQEICRYIAGQSALEKHAEMKDAKRITQ